MDLNVDKHILINFLNCFQLPLFSIPHQDLGFTPAIRVAAAMNPGTGPVIDPTGSW